MAIGLADALAMMKDSQFQTDGNQAAYFQRADEAKFQASPFGQQANDLSLAYQQAQQQYNPYIQQGQQALQRYQGLLNKPINYQYSPTAGQQQQLSSIGTDLTNRIALGNEQIAGQASASGGLFGGNRIRAEGAMAQDYTNQANQMTDQLEQQFAQQGYSIEEAKRRAQLARLQGQMNMGQVAQQGLSQTQGNYYGLIGNMRDEWAGNLTQMDLMRDQAEAQASSQRMGLMGSGLGAAALLGGPVGWGLGGASLLYGAGVG